MLDMSLQQQKKKTKKGMLHSQKGFVKPVITQKMIIHNE